VYARGDFQGDTAAVSLRQGFPSEAGNLALLHWQPDGILDLSDAVSEVHFLFDGGPAHPLATRIGELCPYRRVHLQHLMPVTVLFLSP